MSIYAQNFTVDETTGEVKLIKHLNKIRIDRCTLRNAPGGWNKSGRRARENKKWNSVTKKVRRENGKVGKKEIEIARED